MPVVILPAEDVAKAAERLLSQARERAANPSFQRAVPYNLPAAPPPAHELEALIQAATWLQNMEVPNATMGLTIQEASMIEAMLPRYGRT